MQVRQIAQAIERIVFTAAEGASDAEMAQAIRALLATQSLAAQRHALLYVVKRHMREEAGLFWKAHPKTLWAVHTHCSYAWLARAFGENAVELEHLRWITTSGHPLAERLTQLFRADDRGMPYGEIGGHEHLTFAHFEQHGPEAWLPIWGRTLLCDEHDDLGRMLGATLSVAFRDLWALWDSAGVPDDATCRLVVLHDLWSAWENKHPTLAAREAKMLVDRIGDHLRMADSSLSSAQHVTWQAKRRQFWRPVERVEAVDHHLTSLRVWTKIGEPSLAKDGGSHETVG